MNIDNLAPELKKLMLILYPVWPKGEFPSAAATSFQFTLQDQDYGLLHAAAVEWVRQPGQRFFPKPGELIQIAAQVEERQIREGVRSLPPPEVQYTSLAKLLELKTRMESMGIKNKHIDKRIAEAREREGRAA